MADLGGILRECDVTVCVGSGGVGKTTTAAVMGIDRWNLEDQFGVVASRVSQGPIEKWPKEARLAAQRCAQKAKEMPPTPKP